MASHPPRPPGDRAPLSSHPRPRGLDLCKAWDHLPLFSTRGEGFAAAHRVPSIAGGSAALPPWPPASKVSPFVPPPGTGAAASRVYGGGMVGKRRACPGMRAGFNEALVRGHVHLGGGTKALWLSHRTWRSPAGGLPRALRRPWIFIVSENGPFIGSRWKV